MRKTLTRILPLLAMMLVLLVMLSATAFAAGDPTEEPGTRMIECPDCGTVGACMECYGLDPACEACGGTNVCATCGGTGYVTAPSRFFNTAWSLLPPVIAIALALITKEVYSSLFIGIVTGGLLYSNFQFETTVRHVFDGGIVASVTDSYNMGILVFLIILGAMVCLMNKAGGSAAFGRWAKAHIKSRAGVQLVSILLGVLIFGKSPFGLRFFSALFAAGMVLLVYLFLRDVFRRDGEKHNGWALLGAALFAGGGLLLTVGRLGLCYSLLGCLLVGSLWCMFRFFAYGIDRERPARSACNVLVSGILFALAFCVDPKMLLAAVGIVGLFIAGAVRHARRNAAAAAQIRAELDEKNASERSEEVLYRNIEEAEGKERALRSEAVYQNKLIYLLFFVSFVVGTVLLYTLTALPLYATYARLYDPDPVTGTLSIFTLLGRAFKDSFAVGNVTAFSAGNASSAFGWLIAFKGATLFASEAPYVRLNANINVFMAFTALLAFVFLTVYAVLYLATGRSRSAYNTPYTAHILRAYAVLTAGLLSALLPYAFVSASAVASLPFSALWIAYIPLAFYTAYVHDGSAKIRLFGRFGMNATAIAMAVCITLYAASFILALPAAFAFPFPAAASAACYGWMSLANNGWYR